jgi:formylglycine-generating enzyme
MKINIEEFITVPEGEYVVGLSGAVIDSAYCRVRNGAIKRDFLGGSFPEHSVSAGPVMIRTSLTSRDEFSEFAAETGYVTEAEKDGWGWVMQDGRWNKRAGADWQKPFGQQCANLRTEEGSLPVMQVTWNDAAAYCSWLSGVSGRAVRLPREAEWEIFARICGVDGAADCGGSPAPVSGTEDFLAAVAVAQRAGGRCSAGLVWEWTEDWYECYPGGHPHKDFGMVYKVLRGGSLLSHPVQRTREFRLRKCPTARSPYYGFRFALSR